MDNQAPFRHEVKKPIVAFPTDESLELSQDGKSPLIMDMSFKQSDKFLKVNKNLSPLKK